MKEEDPEKMDKDQAKEEDLDLMMRLLMRPLKILVFTLL